MAEVIKYGVIWDADLFSDLEAATSLDDLASLSPDLLQKMIRLSCQAKADVVTKDEKEANLRAILNYGHTIGHAIESLTGYQTINHGEAVAMGMIAAGQIAVNLQMWTQTDLERQNRLIEKAGLPTKLPPDLDLGAIIESLQTDKKVKDSKVRFILPQKIGTVTITEQVTPGVIRSSLAGNLKERSS